MLTTFTNATISYFEQLLGVNFAKKNENKYRAAEHSSYLLFKGDDDAFHFISFNGDYGDKPLNAFQLTKLIYPNLTGRQIFERLGGNTSVEHTPAVVISKQNNQHTEPQDPKPISFQEDDNALSVFRTFDYFKRKIGITSLLDLKKYHIKTIKEYGKVKDIRNTTPLFAYCEGDNIKIKDPQKVIFKSKVILRTPVKEYVFGLDALLSIPDEEAKHIFIVITEGEDDVLAINYHCKNIKAITFGGVTNALNPAIIEYLKAKFAGVFIGFDNDEAGIKNAPIQAQKHDLPYFICPTNKKHLKDFCDLLKDIKLNSTQFEQLLLQDIAKILLAQREALQTRIVQPTTFKNFPLYICDRSEVLEWVKKDKNALLLCETRYQEKARKWVGNQDTPIFDYKEVSILPKRDTPYHIYCLGSQLLQRNAFENVVQRLLDLASKHKIMLFSDTDADLFFATEKTNVLQHETIYEAVIFQKENLHAGFLTLTQHLTDAKCLECGKSLMKGIDEKRIVSKTDLGFVDKKEETLIVLVNEDLHILPNEFQGFKKVIFVCSDQKPPRYVSVEKRVYNEQFITERIIERLEDNPKYHLERDTMSHFSNALIKPIFDKVQKRWVIPTTALAMLKYQFQYETYAFDYSALARDTGASVFAFEDFITQITPEIQAQAEAIQSEIEVNAEAIKANIEQLKAEKKTAFEALAQETEVYTTVEDVVGYAAQTIITTKDEDGNDQTIVTKRVLKSGEKVFIQRLKELSKYVPFMLAFEFVRNNYYHYEKIKNIARVAKLINFTHDDHKQVSQYAKRLQAFAEKYSQGWYTKKQLVAAFEAANVGHNHCEKELWRQLKNAFLLATKTKRINKIQTRVYQLELLIELEQKELLI